MCRSTDYEVILLIIIENIKFFKQISISILSNQFEYLFFPFNVCFYYLILETNYLILILYDYYLINGI